MFLNKKISKILFPIAISILFLLLPSFVSSAESEGVPVLIYTPSSAIVSLLISTDPSLGPSGIVYGEMPLGTQNAAPVDDPIITVTNNGTVPEDFRIKGADATGEPFWSLSDAQGLDMYEHKFGLAPDFTNWTNLTLFDQTFVSNRSVGESDSFKLRISLPTSASSGLTQHNTSITVTAVQHQE